MIIFLLQSALKWFIPIIPQQFFYEYMIAWYDHFYECIYLL